MLFFTQVFTHCAATHLRTPDGDYVYTRNADDHTLRYPLDYGDLRDMNDNWANVDDAVCHALPKNQSMATVAPGDNLGLAFTDYCYGGLRSESETFMLAGRNVTSAGGDIDEGSGPHHNGGYCEVSISFKENPAWTDFVVIGRWERTCPDSRMDFDFTLPSEMPSGEAVIMWTWHAAAVNQFYSSCVDVTVEGSGEGGLQGLCPIVYNLNNDNDEDTHFFYPGDKSGSTEWALQPGNPEDITSVSTTPAPAMSCQKQPTQFPDVLPGPAAPAGPAGVELPGGLSGTRREGPLVDVTSLSTYATGPGSNGGAVVSSGPAQNSTTPATGDDAEVAETAEAPVDIDEGTADAPIYTDGSTGDTAAEAPEGESDEGAEAPSTGRRPRRERPVRSRASKCDK